MKKILLSVIAATVMWSCKNPEKPVTKSPQTNPVARDSFYIVDDTVTYMNYGLNAVCNSKIIHIVDTSEHLYIRIDTILDYDKDNDMDALILYSESGGGNCCPSVYFLVTNEGNGKFIRSEMTEPSWESLVFETWKDQPGFVITSNNEGMNNDDYEETVYRYVINKGQIKIAETTKTKEIPAIEEIRASEFSFEEGEIKDLVFDLDNDLINDTIRCSFWDRWGRMQPTFIFSTGLSDSSQISAKRIGILSSQTNGVHDLVIDLNQVLKWNGKYYE